MQPTTEVHVSEKKNSVIEQLKAQMKEPLEEERRKIRDAIEEMSTRLNLLRVEELELEQLAANIGLADASAPETPDTVTDLPEEPRKRASLSMAPGPMHELKNASIPTMVEIVLRRAEPAGLEAGQIVKHVKSMRPTINRMSVYAAIYRMRSSDRLHELKQDHGAALYFLTKTKG